MKHRLLSLVASLVVLAAPVLAWAAENDEVHYDPKVTGFTRGEGQGQGMVAGDSSTALTWMLLIFLTIVCVSAMFKHAKRSHLD